MTSWTKAAIHVGRISSQEVAHSRETTAMKVSYGEGKGRSACNGMVYVELLYGRPICVAAFGGL